MTRRLRFVLVLAVLGSSAGFDVSAHAQTATWDGWVGTVEVTAVSEQILTNSRTTFRRGSVVTLTGPGSRRDTSTGTGQGFLTSHTVYPNAIICGQLAEEGAEAEGEFPVEVAITESSGGYSVVPLSGGSLSGTSTSTRLCFPSSTLPTTFPGTVGNGFIPKPLPDPNKLEFDLVAPESCGLGCTGSRTTKIRLQRNGATLEVRKELEPASDPGRFDLLIDGETKEAAAGDGGTTGAIVVEPGAHTVSEESAVGTDGRATALGDYARNIACDDGDTGDPVATGTGSSLGLEVEAGQSIVCVITNASRPILEIEKQTIPDAATTTFSFSGAVTGTARDGEVISARVDAGRSTVSEAAIDGWGVDSISCDATHVADIAARSVTVDLVAGQRARCVFRNKQTCVGKVSQRSFAGQVSGVPENLLPWNVTVGWCYTGETTEVRNMALFGDVPATVFGGLLEAFAGTTFSYNEELSTIEAQPQPLGATLVIAQPQFDMCVNLASAVIGNLPVIKMIGRGTWLRLPVNARRQLLLTLKRQTVAFIRRLGQTNLVFATVRPFLEVVAEWYDRAITVLATQIVDHGALLEYCTPAYTPVMRMLLLPNGGVTVNVDNGSPTGSFRTVEGVQE